MKYEDYKVYRTAIGGKLLELEIGAPNQSER